jgi:hypothetical protein
MTMLHVRMLAQALILGAAAAATASCASVVSGSTQLVTVMSDPSGANCTLSRDGKVVAHVVSTPSAVKIDKSIKDMIVACQRDGYEESKVAMRSTHDAWSSAGNILAWGIFFPLALGIDAASGAMNEYPDSVIVRLNPSAFASAEDRDRHYAQLKAQVKSEAKIAVENIQKKCKASDGCKKDIGKVEAARDAELAAIEERRLRAVVPEPAAEPATSAPAAPAESTPPVAAAEDARRQEIETKWAARLDSVRRLYCTGAEGDQAPECVEKVALVEAQRDAELRALATDGQPVQQN